jgi:hypothetical protein
MNNKIFLIIILVLSSNFAQSEILPQNKQEFCSRFEINNNKKNTIQEQASDPINLTSFKNNGGLFNGGVCWWHSRFQRNIFYLSIFRPDLPRLVNQQEISKIIHQIRLGTSVVTIPGHANFSEFSEANQKLIQYELNDWQLYDGVILGSWINGLKGDTKVNPEVLKTMIDDLYEYVEIQKKVAYQKLQIKGITSHAWLIIGMKKTETGHEIGLLDSNNPRMSQNYSYKFGDNSFFTKSYGNFVPYLEFKREELRITTVAKKYCNVESFLATNSSEATSAYQQDLSEAKAMRE